MLKTAFRWGVKQKLLPAVPEFPTVKVPKKKPKPVPPADFEKLLKQAPDNHRARSTCCQRGGAACGSPSATCNANGRRRCRGWTSRRTASGCPPCSSRATRTSGFRSTAHSRKALEQLPKTGPAFFEFQSRRGGLLSRNGITNRVILLANKAGVKLSMHRLRKGFGCRVAAQLGKGNAPILHRLMRHSSMQVTMDYYASVDDVLNDAIQDLV